MTANELSERMSAAEFDRHLQDQQDYPDANERVAHSCHIIATLVNLFMESWSQGSFRLDDSVVAPWNHRGSRSPDRELTQEEYDAEYDAFVAAKLARQKKT